MDIGEVKLMTRLREQVDKATRWTRPNRHAKRRALAAVREFLRFQIRDHQSGDSTEVTEAAITQ